MYLCTRNYDLKRGGTFETAKAGTFHSVTAGTSIPLFTNYCHILLFVFYATRKACELWHVCIVIRTVMRTSSPSWEGWV